MSSTYRAICLSHDPGIVVEHPEAQSPEPIEAWVRRGATRERQLPAHIRCDLVAGRYSYPLIEVFCPGDRPTGEQRPGATAPPLCSHVDGWVPVEVLRALAAVHHAATRTDRFVRADAVAEALAGMQRAAGPCWTAERVRRVLASEQ